MIERYPDDEQVTIPARLLFHLYAAADILFRRIDADDDDRAMLAEAKAALREQAPLHYGLLDRTGPPPGWGG